MTHRTIVTLLFMFTTVFVFLKSQLILWSDFGLTRMLLPVVRWML